MSGSRRFISGKKYPAAVLRKLRSTRGVGRPVGKKSQHCAHSAASPKRTWAMTIGKRWTEQEIELAEKKSGKPPVPRRGFTVLKGRDEYGRTIREVVDLQ